MPKPPHAGIPLSSSNQPCKYYYFTDCPKSFSWWQSRSCDSSLSPSLHLISKIHLSRLSDKSLPGTFNTAVTKPIFRRYNVYSSEYKIHLHAFIHPIFIGHLLCGNILGGAEEQTDLYHHGAHSPERETHNHTFFFSFLQSHLWHTKAPRLGVESEVQLPAYATTCSNTGSLTH